MAKVGATLETMDQLSQAFRQQAQSAEQLRSAISGQLGSTDWIGQSASNFRDRWTQEYEPSLRALAGELEELGGYVSRKREELHQAGNVG